MSACATACETEPGSRSELFSAYSTTLDADRSALPATDHAGLSGSQAGGHRQDGSRGAAG